MLWTMHFNLVFTIRQFGNFSFGNFSFALEILQLTKTQKETWQHKHVISKYSNGFDCFGICIFRNVGGNRYDESAYDHFIYNWCFHLKIFLRIWKWICIQTQMDFKKQNSDESHPTASPADGCVRRQRVKEVRAKETTGQSEQIGYSILLITLRKGPCRRAHCVLPPPPILKKIINTRKNEY